MSAGEFAASKYASNTGRVYRAKVQPETLALTLGGATNTAPAGAVTEQPSARMTGGKTETGVIARTVTMVWTGAAPTGYDVDGRVTVPILQVGMWNDLIPDVTTGTYLGSGCRVVGVSPERIN